MDGSVDYIAFAVRQAPEDECKEENAIENFEVTKDASVLQSNKRFILSQNQSVDGSRSSLLTAIRRSNFRLAASSGRHVFHESISIPISRGVASTTSASQAGMRTIRREIQGRGKGGRILFRSFTVDPPLRQDPVVRWSSNSGSRIASGSGSTDITEVGV
ncbi:unnamed protein product [Hymenolepis diminuta]|uniref:E3 ubiquitin-protein ligase HECW1 n=1 Tax=Hymenolepis diminuta TaxID=6216 RepID=A0A0R3SWS6_HYMDI|nr:unnamed protein product [Hymenolepis diminuta]VUZ40998.1 unnamed protein product [Hymenolepis diminuta]